MMDRPDEYKLEVLFDTNSQCMTEAYDGDGIEVPHALMTKSDFIHVLESNAKAIIEILQKTLPNGTPECSWCGKAEGGRKGNFVLVHDSCLEELGNIAGL